MRFIFSILVSSLLVGCHATGVFVHDHPATQACLSGNAVPLASFDFPVEVHGTISSLRDFAGLMSKPAIAISPRLNEPLAEPWRIDFSGKAKDLLDRVARRFEVSWTPVCGIEVVRFEQRHERRLFLPSTSAPQGEWRGVISQSLRMFAGIHPELRVYPINVDGSVYVEGAPDALNEFARFWTGLKSHVESSPATLQDRPHRSQ